MQPAVARLTCRAFIPAIIWESALFSASCGGKSREGTRSERARSSDEPERGVTAASGEFDESRINRKRVLTSSGLSVRLPVVSHSDASKDLAAPFCSGRRHGRVLPSALKNVVTAVWPHYKWRLDVRPGTSDCGSFVGAAAKIASPCDT